MRRTDHIAEYAVYERVLRRSFVTSKHYTNSRSYVRGDRRQLLLPLADGSNGPFGGLLSDIPEAVAADGVSGRQNSISGRASGHDGLDGQHGLHYPISTCGRPRPIPWILTTGLSEASPRGH